MFTKKGVNMPSFKSRAEAFAYMLRYQLDEKKADPMEAAKRANEFAEIFAGNLGLPKEEEKPKAGVEKVIGEVDKVVCYCEEHPKVVEFLTGALTSAASIAVGFFAGKQNAPTADPPKREEIDFDKID